MVVLTGIHGKDKKHLLNFPESARRRARPGDSGRKENSLGFDTQIVSAYKLCDFKPVYGLMFPEIIEGYDFWGQCDIDLIYGNIRNFMNDETLDKFDFISVRHDYTTGCFGLYRNNNLMNTIFKRSKDYKKVLADTKHYCFDECNFMHTQLHQGISIFDIDTEIDTLTHIIKSAELSKEINAHFDFIMLEGVPGKIKFDHGFLTYKNSFEVMLYHLYWLKRIYNPGNRGEIVPNVYSISPSRIYK
jgi:hypothetical protein